MRFVWGALLVLVLGVEAVAIFNGRRGDTLTENVWRLRGFRVVQSALAGFLAWLGWHLLLEQPDTDVLDDLVAVALGLVVGWFLPQPDRAEPASVRRLAQGDLPMNSEPVLTGATIAAAAGAIGTFLLTFWSSLSSDQQSYATYAVNAVATVVGAWWARSKVTPVPSNGVDMHGFGTTK
jgi:hypothetical protein